jgi:polysaccharide biosynthesis/export protein
MDPSLFQFNDTWVLHSLKHFGISNVRATTCSARRAGKPVPMEKSTTPSCSADRESFFILQAILGLAFFLIATPALAQSVANSSVQSSAQGQASAGINQRSQQARENLAGDAVESQSSESRIGPDDLLNISIFEAPEMNCTVRVSASGQISLQLLGAVHAAGLTPRELESVLQGQLRRTYMKDPHVGVFVQELQSHSVSVVGAVKMPGVFQIRGRKTVIELLSMAEGLADDAGDTVLIMHGAGYAESGSSESPHPKLAGIAPVPPIREVFANYNRSQPMTPEEKGEIEEINLKKLLESADSALNVPVLPGDIVKVSRAGIVYVVGEVQKPGGFVLQNNENISVLQALALAQGPTHTSAISQARIIRTDPATGKRTEIPMNLGKILSGKKPDTLLQPKDIVFVPNSAAKSVLYRGSEAALQTATGVAIYRW